LFCNHNGKIPAAKMTTNKTKIKPQKQVVFTSMRWPTVRSHFNFTKTRRQCCKLARGPNFYVMPLVGSQV
jgi:hypothetical protein